LPQQWSIAHGELTLWDYFKMNEYLDYKQLIEDKIKYYQLSVNRARNTKLG